MSFIVRFHQTWTTFQKRPCDWCLAHNMAWVIPYFTLLSVFRAPSRWRNTCCSPIACKITLIPSKLISFEIFSVWKETVSRRRKSWEKTNLFTASVYKFLERRGPLPYCTSLANVCSDYSQEPNRCCFLLNSLIRPSSSYLFSSCLYLT